VVPNGVNLRAYTPRPADTEIRSRLGSRQPFVVGYLGTHGMAHGLDFVLRTVQTLDNTKYHFLFVGDGAEKRSLVALAKVLRLTNVTFWPMQTKDMVPRILSALDAALVPLKDSRTFDSVIPSKIFEAASMKIPILLGVRGESAKLVREFGAGLCYEPENAESFRSALERLRTDEGFRKQCGLGGPRLAQFYDRGALALQMLEVLRQAVR